MLHRINAHRAFGISTISLVKVNGDKSMLKSPCAIGFNISTPDKISFVAQCIFSGACA